MIPNQYPRMIDSLEISHRFHSVSRLQYSSRPADNAVAAALPTQQHGAHKKYINMSLVQYDTCMYDVYACFNAMTRIIYGT